MRKSRLWSLKISFLCGALAAKGSSLLKCLKQTRRQMNKPFARSEDRTCWETIFRAQRAGDRRHALNSPARWTRESPSEMPPCDIIYVPNLSDNQARPASPSAEKPNVSVSRRGTKNLSQLCRVELKTKGLWLVFILCTCSQRRALMKRRDFKMNSSNQKSQVFCF